MRAILVIKHGALGDIVLAASAFAAIREAHPKSHVTLLTTKPYAALLEKSPYFDEVWVDGRPKPWQLRKLRDLRNLLRLRKFKRVYDLQTSQRSSGYYRLFADPKPEWSGIVKAGSHPHDNPKRGGMHSIDRLQEQLAIAGITEMKRGDISWLKAETGKFVDFAKKGKGKFALLVPGGSAHRPQKRWPAEHFIKLAQWMISNGTRPVFIGAGAEKELLDHICEKVGKKAVNLCNQTSFGDIAELARGALIAVGNDTGPMHLIAATGCPVLTLFSSDSDPEKSAPRGTITDVMQRDDLSKLSVEEVIRSSDLLLQNAAMITPYAAPH